MFTRGSIWFSLWSLAAAFAPTSGAFIGFVAALGVFFSASFPPGPKRNNAYGVLGAGQPLGFILGLILGGVLTQSRATWRAVFYMQSGLGLVFVILGFLFLAKPPRVDDITPRVWIGEAQFSAPPGLECLLIDGLPRRFPVCSQGLLWFWRFSFSTSGIENCAASPSYSRYKFGNNQAPIICTSSSSA
ncbi:hypothetical protein B0H14DRAFT_2970954 [Mycena olivaceomarginata]|nr:hypothetical protein B0H14DRAFT_2970954 [Mycena olivaceomarginata]